MICDFELTYRSYYQQLYRIAAKMLRDSDVARDIVHDVFLAYYLTLEDKKLVKDVKSWLVRSTINKSVDFLRKNKKIVTEVEMPKQNTESYNIDNQIDELSLADAVSKLDGKEQSLMVLYSEGYSYKEIAEMAGINFNSVGKTLSRILEKLRKNYGTLR